MENNQQNKDKTSNNYFWLKLHKDYFSRLAQKKMRRQEHGKEIQIVYLRMMLLGIDKGGYIYYQGVYDSLEEELSEEFDEPLEIIRETLDYLKKNNMISIDENSDCFVPETLEMTGKETKAAGRMRKMREKKKNEDVTLLQGVTNSDTHVTNGYIETEKNRTETDLHLNSDKSKSLDVKSKTETEQADADPVSVDQRAASAAANAEPPAGDLFSVKQLLAIVEKNKVNLTDEGVQAFHDEMYESGWILYQKPVEKKWIVRALRGWAKHHPEYSIEEDERESGSIMPEECRKYIKEWLDWRLSCDINDDYFEINDCEYLRSIIFDFEHEDNQRETIADIRKRIKKEHEKEFDLLCNEWRKATKVKK